ncbi:MAG TPA: molybdate ABC transporter substrate-binding protein [Bacteroidia bacterium]|nr:molybdate ABC transporter substrate-binding protein [Bacteroidia bacterium]
MNQKIKWYIVICALIHSIVLTAQQKNKSIIVYAGAASKPPVEEIVKQFQIETGIKVEVIFGGSGYVMSQMKLTGKGDIYFPGSSDYMEIAKREKLVFPETEKKVVYLVNAINVQKGNPKNIKSLKDLCKPGIKVAIANPEGVCVGAYAVEIVEKNLNTEEKKQFQKNLVNYTESCDKTAAAIALKTVDAVIGWEVFQHWNPELIESVPLKKDEIIRIGYIPIAVAVYAKNKKLALQFIDYVTGPKGKSVFKKYKYFTTLEETEKYIGDKKPLGGEYIVPKSWITK